jgi:hypothetical protein
MAHRPGGVVNRCIVLLWASFLAAGVAEVLFFTVIDPAQLYFLGREVELGALATHTVGFVFFWLLSLGAGVLSVFLLNIENR